MKDSKGREISISRLDMLTDEEIAQLKGDSWDDYCWKSGNQYARMVHEFCVIEQDKRIRAEEARKVAAKIAAAEEESERRLHQAKMDMLLARHDYPPFFKKKEKGNKKKPEETPKEVSKSEPTYVGSVAKQTRGMMRERLTGTE